MSMVIVNGQGIVDLLINNHEKNWKKCYALQLGGLYRRITHTGFRRHLSAEHTNY